jgi:MFS family permease
MSFSNNVHSRLQTLIPIEKRSKTLAFALVATGAALDNFNIAGSMATVVSTVQHFDSNTTTVSWTLSAYALTLGAFIMLGGKLTDILGPNMVFISALFITGIFALICAVIEKQIIVLIVFRAFQGVSASFTIPSAFAIAGNLFEGAQLGRAFTILIICMTSILGVGFVVGGAFSLSSIGYKGIYYLTFAVSSLLSIILYFIHVPIPKSEQHKDMKLRYLDYGGSALFVVGILLIILGLTEGGESWHKPRAYVPLPIGFVILVCAFLFEVVFVQNYKDKVDVLIESTKQASEKEDADVITEVEEANTYLYKLHMLFPRQLIYLTNFFPFVLTTLAIYLHFIMLIAALTQYHQFLQGNSPLITGLKILPLSVGLTVVASLNLEKFFYRIGMKRVLIFSQFCATFMLLWISRLNFERKNSFWIYQFVPLTIYGGVVNMYFGIYINALMRRTPGHLQGVVSGFLQTVGQVGVCLGNALTATILGELEPASTLGEKNILVKKFNTCFYVILAASAVGTLILFTIKNQKSVNPDEIPEDDSEEATV